MRIERRLGSLSLLLGLLYLLLELGEVLLEELLDLVLVLITYERINELQVAACLGLALFALDHKHAALLFFLLSNLLFERSFRLALILGSSDAGLLGG